MSDLLIDFHRPKSIIKFLNICFMIPKIYIFYERFNRSLTSGEGLRYG